MIPRNPKISRRTVMTGAAAFAASIMAFPSYAKDLIAKSRNGVAIKGYDTTAYFQLGDPREGDVSTIVEWKGAKWYFTTPAEADMFRANPEAFAPKFGGHCTRAMSLKKSVHGDPEVWRIRNDKLYLFAKSIGRDYFDKGPDAMIAKAQAHWDTLV